MLSLCVPIVEDSLIKEVFIGCWPVRSTTADVITDAILEGIQSASLDPTNIVAVVSFDGASNISGSKKGVQALLKVHEPKLVFVHCRSHLLQLALVRVAGLVPDVKRILSMLSKLYSLFQHSPMRLNVLLATEVAIDGLSHKLVQPGETRCLSYEGSVAVVCKHYAAISLALESIYVEVGDLTCDAGGLLLVLRKHSTLARLSKALQTSMGNMSSATSLARATIEGIEECDFAALAQEASDAKEVIVSAGVNIEEDFILRNSEQIGKKFVYLITENLKARFSDEVSQLCTLQDILK
jgi:hypothetical protein